MTYIDFGDQNVDNTADHRNEVEHVPWIFEIILQNQMKCLKIYNKLWCESTTNPTPVLRIAVSRGFSELTKNVIRSSHGHSTPSQKISCKSVQPFSRNLTDKETNK